MSLIKKYKSDNSGAIAAITGIVIFALIASAGAAIEITRIVHYKSKLQHAADSAVLAAISQSSEAYHEFSNRPDQDKIDTSRSADDIRNFFAGNSGENEGVKVVVTAAKVEIENANLVSNINYTAKIDLIFGKLLQYPSVEITGHAEARRELDVSKTKNRPIDVHLFLDNSPSMGIGSREKDIEFLQKQNIYDDTGCAFACHLAGPDNKSMPQDLERFRNNNSLTLRIDELRTAAVKLISDVEHYQTLDKISSPNEKIRFSAYSFAESQVAAIQAPIRKIFELSDKYEVLSNYIGNRSKFDMQIVGEDTIVKIGDPYCVLGSYNGCAQSDIATVEKHLPKMFSRDNSPLSEAMDYISNEITKYRSDRNQLMFLVTDGVANYTNSQIATCYESKTGKFRSPQTNNIMGKLGDCVGPIDINMCNNIKNKGIRIAVVYTEYRQHIKKEDPEFKNIVLPQLDDVEEKLRECASPNLYSKSEFNGNIYQTMRDVFQRATMNLKLVE